MRRIHRDQRVRRTTARCLASVAAAAALVAGVVATGVAPSSAAIVEVSNVGAAMTAPATANGPFDITATIKNTGTLPQVSGAKVTITAANGAVTAALGCQVSEGTAVCTTTQGMIAGASKTYSVTVTPAAGAPSVVTQVVTQANQPDLNAPGSPADDTVSQTTTVFALALDLTNEPTTVKPGNDTRLDAAVTNQGAPQTSATVTIDTGGLVDTRLPVPAGCGVDPSDAGKLTCAGISIGLGETVHLVVAAVTPTSGATSMHSIGTVVGQAGSNASDAVDTTLSADAKEAFVPPGGGVCSQESHESSCFDVPSTWEGGTVVGLFQQFLPGTMCGTQLCSPYIAEALWPKSSNPAHNDPNNPLMLRITYNTRQSCNGSGWGSGCHQLYWMNNPTDTAKLMPQCPTYRVSNPIPAVMADPNVPCLNFVSRNPQGIVTYDVAILIDTLIPKISL